MTGGDVAVVAVQVSATAIVNAARVICAPFSIICRCRVENKRGRIRRVKRPLILSLLCCAPWIATAQIHVSGAGVSGVAIYAPYPKYPAAARESHWTGRGILACKLRPDGTVSSVEVLQSTGHAILDQAAIAALRQWRFTVRGGDLVKVPIRFTMGGVRHRMAGAVISD